MKVRNGFVSNSSSSSFILSAYSANEFRAKVEVDLSYFGNIISDEEGVAQYIRNKYPDAFISDEEGVAQYIRNKYPERVDAYVNEQKLEAEREKQRLLSEIKSGRVLLICEIDDYDYGIVDSLSEQGLSLAVLDGITVVKDLEKG